MKEIYEEVAKKLELPVEVVEATYENYWKFFKTKIEELPLKSNLTEEEFKKLKTSFNVPSVGKFFITWPHYKKINDTVRKYYEDKENKALVQQNSDNM